MTINILGVDFRKDSVYAVQIRGSYNGIWVGAHAHVFLERPEDLEKGLASCLETISGQTNLPAVCVAALPSDQFFYRNIVSPFTDPRKIDQMLPYELEQSLPVPADELIIDFITVSQGAPEKKILLWLGQLPGLDNCLALRSGQHRSGFWRLQSQNHA